MYSITSNSFIIEAAGIVIFVGSVPGYLIMPHREAPVYLIIGGSPDIKSDKQGSPIRPATQLAGKQALILNMKRRSFAYLTAAGIAAVTLPTWVYPHSPEFSSILANPELLSLIFDADTIIAVGKAYLKDNPDENNEHSLVKLLTRNISADADNIQELLQQQIVQDFRQERIVIVEGWLLSLTEARQCALLSILTHK